MFGDFVAQLGASTGTGQYSLGSTFGSTVTWRSEFASDDVVGYLATTQDATKREVGWGIFTIGTPDKLHRNVVPQHAGERACRLGRWGGLPHL